MTSRPLDFRVVAGNFDMDFGHAKLTPQGHNQLRRRSSVLEKRLGFNKKAKWSMGTKDKKFLLTSDPSR